MNDIRRFYDLTASGYADTWYPNNLMLPSINEYLSLFGKSPRILDLGCGPGNESMRLANGGAEVVGIDFSTESIKIAKKRNPVLAFHQMDFFDMDDRLGRFDGVFSCASLIHLKADEIDRLLRMIGTIHDSGGYFLVIFRKGEGEVIQHPEINGERLSRIIQRYPEGQMKEIFGETGYAFFKDGIIDASIREYWHSQIYRKS